MNPETIDWDALSRLRTRFLEGSAGYQDYWQSESDLASYDQTFAQRIAWKWDHVLNELRCRRWAPPPGPVLDWGCGTGIASRAVLRHFPAETASHPVLLFDRSRLAVEFARRAIRELSGSAPELWMGAEPFSTLLLSHVLTELNAAQLGQLLELTRQATAVLWVEPGTFDAARQLSEIRDQLVDAFHVLAPCTHQNRCPMRNAGQAENWCHHFAAPPPKVFTDGNWARFGALAGIDLRSLPLSYLVLDRRPMAAPSSGATRVIGRARIYKAHALLLGCCSEGLCERRLTKRRMPGEFRELKKGRSQSLQTWECVGDEIVAASGLVPE